MTSIDVQDLTKEYGTRRAVDHLTFRVLPGRVTGFLGPNGAGKSTTMRLVLGLDRPSSGSATIDGRAYATLREPLHQVGALLDAQAAHGSRTGRDHLRTLAAGNRIPDRRVDELLEETGLASVARRRVRTYSLGMRQRLGIAGCPARRPRGGHARRAVERPRPRRHHLDPRVAAAGSRPRNARSWSPAI